MWIRGYVDTRMVGYVNVGIYMDTGIGGYADTGYEDGWICECGNIYGYRDWWIRGYRIRGWVDM